MNNMYKIVLIAVIVIVIIFVLSVRVKPFYDSPANHIEELKKQIPEVEAFYQKYGHHDIMVFPDGVYTYQVGFQSKKGENEWIMLRINYLYGIPFSSTVFCTPDGVDTQFRITDNVLDYLRGQDCFEK